jgi:hypothetical protein
VEYALAVGSAKTAGFGGRLGERYFGPLCKQRARTQALSGRARTARAFSLRTRAPASRARRHETDAYLLKHMAFDVLCARLCFCFCAPVCVCACIFCAAVRDGNFDAARVSKPAWDGKKRPWVDKTLTAAVSLEPL